MKKQFLLFGLLLLILFAACKKQSFNASKQATIDDDKIKAYIAANHINAIKDTSGIYYQIITQIDSGAKPTVADTVQVTYTGKLLNGSVFDSEVASNFPLSNVITAWKYMIPLIAAKATAGGPYSRIRFIVPSALGYGTTAESGIPANSVLDFTIDLIGFYPYPPTIIN
jgi:FKBP-type peptidyl-prolyl cis-trans isomerase FkpA